MWLRLVMVAGLMSAGTSVFGQLNGAYTINKTLPTGGVNFNSFAAAALMLQTVGVSGPVYLSVTPGSGPYTEQVTFGKIPGASVVNRITLDGGGDTLEFLPPAAQIFVLRLAGTNYFTLKNLYVRSLATGAVNTAAIMVSDTAAFDTIRGCTAFISPANTGPASAGIAFSSLPSSSNNPGKNAAHFVIFQNEIIGGATGLSLVGSPGGGAPDYDPIVGIEALFNALRNFRTTGIDLQYTEGALIQNNDLSRPDLGGNVNFVGINVSQPCFSTKISRNTIHDTHPAATGGAFTGIRVGGQAAAGRENVVANNLIYNIDAPAGHTGINVTAAFTQIYYNSIDLSFAGSTAGNGRGIQVGAADRVEVLNNIVRVTRATNAAGNRHALFIAAPTNFACDHNVLYVAGGTGNNFIAAFAGVNFPTLTDWQASNAGLYGQNSVELDPIFLNPLNGDLTPTAVAVHNLGLPVSVTTDITGALRHPANPDPGAYEITVLASSIQAFTGRWENRGISLQWSAEPSGDFSFFELSRQAANGEFEPIHRTPAGGGLFSYFDENPPPMPHIAYRLSWTDLSGRAFAGPVIQVRNPGSHFRILRAAWVPDLSLEWQGEAAKVTAILYDLTGREVSRLSARGAEGGLQATLPGLPSGGYLLEVRADGERVYFARLFRP